MTHGLKTCEKCRGIGKRVYGPNNYATCDVCHGTGQISYEILIDEVQERLDRCAIAAMQALLTRNAVIPMTAKQAYEMALLMEAERERVMHQRKSR